jgi:DNA-directed RNA polymerase specialized sigma24 family protein
VYYQEQVHLIEADCERLVTGNEATSGSTPESVPDAALVRATLGGEEAAFAGLVRRYLRKAMAAALEYAGTRENAEDIVQDTFRRLLENLDRYDPERPFEPWFFTILRNTARNAARHRRIRDHEALSFRRASTPIQIRSDRSSSSSSPSSRPSIPSAMNSAGCT